MKCSRIQRPCIYKWWQDPAALSYCAIPINYNSSPSWILKSKKSTCYVHPIITKVIALRWNILCAFKEMYNYACICYIVVKEKKHITHKEVLTKLEAEFNEARYHNITISCSDSYWDKIEWNWIFHNLFKTKTDLKARENYFVMIKSICLIFNDDNSLRYQIIYLPIVWSLNTTHQKLIQN